MIKDKKYDIGRLIIIDPPHLIDAQNCSCTEIDIYCCSFCANKDSCLDLEDL